MAVAEDAHMLSSARLGPSSPKKYETRLAIRLNEAVEVSAARTGSDPSRYIWYAAPTYTPTRRP